MKSEKELLDLFCSKSENEIRPVLHYPWLQDGYVCASDGRILIRIAETLCDGEYSEEPDGKKPPKVSEVIRQPNVCIPVTRQMLETAISKTPKEEKDRTCPECGGDGSVSYEYHDREDVRWSKECECPCCDGTGLIGDYTAKTTTFGFGGCDLVYGHLIILIKTMDALGVNTLRARYIGKPTETLMFDVEGMDLNIGMMPVYANNILDRIEIV